MTALELLQHGAKLAPKKKEGHYDPLVVAAQNGRTETVLALPDPLRVAASEQIVDAIENVLGAGAMTFR